MHNVVPTLVEIWADENGVHLVARFRSTGTVHAGNFLFTARRVLADQ